MADAARSDRPPRPKLSVAETWRLLNFEQRAAALGAVLLIVSTFGPFSFVEAAIVLVAASVLLLLRRRAEGRDFHIPFGDGAMIALAGVWAALLIVVRLFDKPLGQNLLALVCAALLVLAGLRERAKHPLDDLPPPRRPERTSAAGEEDEVGWTEPVPDRSAYRDETLPLKEVDPQRPAKVLPPAPRQEDLEPPPAWPESRAEPPAWPEPPGEDRG